MKILFSAEEFFPVIGGAEVFTHELINQLAKKHEIYIIFAGKKKEGVNAVQIPIDRKKLFRNIPLFNRTWIRFYYANKRWGKILEKYVTEIKPDLIFTQLVLSPASIKVAKKHNIKNMVYIHNYEHFCPSLFMGKDPLKDKENWIKYMPLQYKVQFPYISKMKKLFEESLRNTDMVIANSQYVADVVDYYYNIHSEVLFPVIDIDKFEYNENSKKYITFINPIKNKGVQIFLQLAKKMQNENFLVIGGAYSGFIDEVKKLPNVTYKSWLPDMSEVYTHTECLLVPSIWPEPFGRVVLEAQINSIPVITSSKGGLPEAVGTGGIIIEDIYNVDKWAESILLIRKDYKKYSKNAKEHAKQYTLKKQMKRFELLLKKVTGS